MTAGGSRTEISRGEGGTEMLAGGSKGGRNARRVAYCKGERGGRAKCRQEYQEEEFKGEREGEGRSGGSAKGKGAGGGCRRGV